MTTTPARRRPIALRPQPHRAGGRLRAQLVALLLAALAAPLAAPLAGDLAAPGVPGAWEIVGPGSPCASGVVPVFEPLGSLVDNPGVAAFQVIQVADGPPHAPAFLVLGFAGLGLPFKGGVLGPRPDLILAFTLDAEGYQGTGFLLGVMPEPLPHGFSIWFQWWLANPGGTLAFCSSPSVRGTVASM